MAKKARTPKKKGKKEFTKEMILEDWKKAVQKGLGQKKTLDPSIALAFEAKLLAKIQERLDAKGDYYKEGPATRVVATFIGIVCKMMTPGNTVLLGVFEKVFNLAQLHPACPGGSGSGQWCSI